jgi:hypothetical protein
LKDVAQKYSPEGNIIPVEGDISSKEGISKIVQEVEKNSPNGINVL